jgi:hypothetical protein
MIAAMKKFSPFNEAKPRTPKGEGASTGDQSDESNGGSQQPRR